jgi:hypothetical protein
MRPTISALRLAEVVGRPSRGVTVTVTATATATATVPRSMALSSRLLPSMLGTGRISPETKESQQYPQHHTRRGFTTTSSVNSSVNNQTGYNLCFLRHGQSTWNRDNRFIGWTDTPLTDDGVLEARVAGKMLKNSGIQFDEVHTSLLRRCIRTTNLVLMEVEQEYIPVHKVSVMRV